MKAIGRPPILSGFSDAPTIATLDGLWKKSKLVAVNGNPPHCEKFRAHLHLSSQNYVTPWSNKGVPIRHDYQLEPHFIVLPWAGTHEHSISAINFQRGLYG